MTAEHDTAAAVRTWGDFGTCADCGEHAPAKRAGVLREPLCLWCASAHVKAEAVHADLLDEGWLAVAFHPEFGVWKIDKRPRPEGLTIIDLTTTTSAVRLAKLMSAWAKGQMLAAGFPRHSGVVCVVR